ncbi:GMP synthase [glutamine-hydrolyzing] [compost metagenome]
MNILILKHFELGNYDVVHQWAEQRGYNAWIREAAIGLSRKEFDTADLIIIMGGPMSVYEEETYPWLIQEKEYILEAIRQNQKVLGICFGAQMLAELLGGRVYRHDHKEIGWHRISRTGENHPWLQELPEDFYSFQWHGDTFELPQGAVWLAQSEGCRNQAFAYNENTVGLQFHLETSPESVELMLHHWKDALVEAPYIQTKEQIVKEMDRSETAIGILYSILDRIAGEIASGGDRNET